MSDDCNTDAGIKPAEHEAVFVHFSSPPLTSAAKYDTLSVVRTYVLFRRHKLPEEVNMEGPLWKSLNTASSFDLITPVMAFIQDAVNGPPAHFGISPYTGLRFKDIRRLLNSYGVKVWGLMLSTDAQVVMFTVRKSQAKWTYYLLQREGIPILYAPDEAVQFSERRTKREASSATPLDPVFGFLNKLYNEV
jgi:hypothetical protein